MQTTVCSEAGRTRLELSGEFSRSGWTPELEPDAPLVVDLARVTAMSNEAVGDLWKAVMPRRRITLWLQPQSHLERKLRRLFGPCLEGPYGVPGQSLHAYHLHDQPVPDAARRDQ